MMKVTILGATGDLGKECLQQCIDAGHDVTVLVRTPSKLPDKVRDNITIVEGDGLSVDDVAASMKIGTEAVLFAVGVDEKTSPQDLCTDVTQHVLAAMRRHNIPKLVWCGGGSNIRKEDVVTSGAKFVKFFAEIFLKKRHTDKEHQLTLLDENRDIKWIGIRPLQMRHGPKKENYRLGYIAFSAMSKIHFADCAHAMVNMLVDDTWVGEAPIIQY